MAAVLVPMVDIRELEPPEMPLRSRLCSLEPIGIGTPYVESLGSFTMRLAEVHCVWPNILVEQEILPLFRKACPANPPRLSGVWKRAQSLNGTQVWAADWVQVLQALAMRQDLAQLTMLPWANALPSRGLLRRTRAWCPACYEEWRGAGQIVYEPLLWALEVVTVCPRHNRPLQTSCPHEECRQSLRVLDAYSRPGYCSHCGRWLGNLEGASSETPVSEEQTWQEWVGTSVGDLLAAAPGLVSSPGREAVAAAISTCLEQGRERSARASARRIGVSEWSVRKWQDGTQLPQLDSLLRLSYFLGVPLLPLLTEPQPAISPCPGAGSPQKSPSIRRRAPRKVDQDQLQALLEAAVNSDEVPPPTMQEVARRLGYDHSYLLKRFRAQCQAISQRCLDYRQAEGRRRTQEFCAEVRRATLDIHAQGRYPSIRQVKKLLAKPGCTRIPEVAAVWQATLRELGWR